MKRRILNLRFSLGLLAGLVSATLTILIPAAFGAFAAGNDFAFFFSPFCLGSIFGLVVSAYLWVFADQRDVLKAFLFVVASTVAYAAAWWSTFLYTSFVHGGFKPPGSLSSFFLGGAVGAFLVLLSAQLLFAECPWKKALRGSLAWSLLGGVLGSLGWALGPSLGDAVFLIIFPSAKGVDELPAYSFACYLIWQIGIAQIVDMLVVPVPDESVLTADSESTPPFPIGVPVVVFLVLLAFAAGWFANLPPSVSTWSFLTGKTGRTADEPPLLAKLPYVESSSPSLVLIAEPVAGYQVKSVDFLGAQVPAFDNVTGKPTSPESRHYAGHYALSGALPSATPTISVDIQEFPDSAWANWMLRKHTVPPFAMDRVQKFNNAVFSLRTPTNANYAVFVWASDRFLLQVQFNGVVSDDFLKAYLQKYPSSAFTR